MAKKKADATAEGRGVHAASTPCHKQAVKRDESRAPQTPARPSALVDTRVIYCGDNLEQLAKLPDACVDLIYIDPPFNSNRNCRVFWLRRPVVETEPAHVALAAGQPSDVLSNDRSYSRYLLAGGGACRLRAD